MSVGSHCLLKQLLHFDFVDTPVLLYRQNHQDSMQVIIRINSTDDMLYHVYILIYSTVVKHDQYEFAYYFYYTFLHPPR